MSYGHYDGSATDSDLTSTGGTYEDVYGQEWQVTSTSATPSTTLPMPSTVKVWHAQLINADNIYKRPTDKDVVTSSAMDGGAGGVNELLDAIDTWVAEWKKEHDTAQAKASSELWLMLLLVAALVASDKKRH